MFNIRRSQLQKLRSAQPGRSIGSMFNDLGFDELLDSSTRAELVEAFNLTFGPYVRDGVPPPGGVKVPAFDALRLAEGLCDTWRALYVAVANSREQLLQENATLKEEAAQETAEKDPRLQKVQGELSVKKEQLQTLSELFSQRGDELQKLQTGGHQVKAGVTSKCGNLHI